MKRLLIALCIVIIVVTASLHAQAPPPQTTITGRVVAEATGQPVRRAYVIAHGPDTKTTRVTMSDGEGAFRFDGLPADRYRVGASKRPHLSAAIDATGADVVISLPTGAVVTGSVIDLLGQPASRTEVSISGPALPSPQMVTTNQQGDYRFYSLPPGDYTISPTTRKGESRTVTVGSASQHQVPSWALQPTKTPVIPGYAAPAAGTGVIAGVALDALSKEPLSGATVSSRRTARIATTDEAGRFRLEGLGIGTYSLVVQGDGFLPTSSAEVLLTENARVIDVTLYGGRTGSIAGTVRDEVGDPVVGMPVMTYRRQFINFQAVMFPRGSGRTDDRGMFEVRGLPPGDYLLCACAGEPLAIDPRLLRELGQTAPDSTTLSRLLDDTVQTFAPAFYPGLARASDSQMVLVDYGDARSGMDITMYGAKPFAVSGLLVDVSGAPATRMQVFLTQDGDLPGAMGVSGTQPVTVGADGRFQFFGVTPGTYSINAIPATAGNRTPWASTEVAVVDRDVQNFIVTVGSGLSVKGRVEFSGNAARPTGAALEKTRVGLSPLEISMAMFMSMGNAGTVGHSAMLDSNGQFSMDGLPPGRFLVTVHVPDSPWRTVQRLAASAAATLNNVVTVNADGETDLLIVMSDVPLATVTGTIPIARERYESAGSMRATIFPADSSRWLEPERHPGQFQWAWPNADGSFRLELLPPGDYYILRTSSFDDLMSVRSLERWAKTAERVTLRAGETTVVTVKR